MKFRFSLKQIFGLALIGSVIWTILLCAYWEYRWAVGATMAMIVFGLVGLLTMGLTILFDRMAFLIHRR